MMPHKQKLNEVPALSPPATEGELAWWRSIRGPIGWRQGLLQGVPFFVIWLIIDAIRGRIGYHSFVLVPMLATLASVVVWATTEKHHRNRHIRWKRIRDELGLTSDELPSTAPDASLP